MQAQEDIFLTPEEAAMVLKVNERQIVRMIVSGKLKAKDISVGTGARKQWRILSEDVMKVAQAE